MKTLLLLRHAKSDWDDSTLDDHERTLNGRGQLAAPRMGKLLRDTGLVPAFCLTSTAVRARATAALVRTAMDASFDIEQLGELYSFGNGEAIARAIAGHGGTASPLLVVAHNPAIQAVALEACASGDAAALTSMRTKYPTAGLAHIEFEITSWSQMSTAKGHLKAFWRPRDLT